MKNLLAVLFATFALMSCDKSTSECDCAVPPPDPSFIGNWKPAMVGASYLSFRDSVNGKVIMRGLFSDSSAFQWTAANGKIRFTGGMVDSGSYSFHGKDSLYLNVTMSEALYLRIATIPAD